MTYVDLSSKFASLPAHINSFAFPSYLVWKTTVNFGIIEFRESAISRLPRFCLPAFTAF